MITELGWSLIRWENGEEVHEFGHLIVDEHQKYTNGKYVPERRKVNCANHISGGYILVSPPVELQFWGQRSAQEARFQVMDLRPCHRHGTIWPCLPRLPRQ